MPTEPPRPTAAALRLRTLDRRELGRATLARQSLLERSTRPVEDLVAQLAGLQAQTPQTWYVGLWSRLAGFDPERVSALLLERRLVRIALMRATIHLVTTDDALAWRPLLDPVIERGLRGNWGAGLDGVDRTSLVEVGRALVEERPLTFAALGSALAEQWPDRDPATLAQAIRTWVPLVQVPPRGLWGRSGPVAHTSVEHWTGSAVSATSSLEDLVLRYLGAFGPATVRDVQTWSGLTRLREILERLRPRLACFRTEDGADLYDLPEAPRPPADVPAPPRYLYDFDNLLLSHADRSRVLLEEVRRLPSSGNGVLPSLLLVDGVTAATWRLGAGADRGVLTVTPLRPLSRPQVSALTAEGVRLLALLAPGSPAQVRVAGGGRPE